MNEIIFVVRCSIHSQKVQGKPKIELDEYASKRWKTSFDDMYCYEPDEDDGMAHTDICRKEWFVQILNVD